LLENIGPAVSALDFHLHVPVYVLFSYVIDVTNTVLSSAYHISLLHLSHCIFHVSISYCEIKNIVMSITKDCIYLILVVVAAAAIKKRTLSITTNDVYYVNLKLSYNMFWLKWAIDR
jgi:hypothetical protein